VKTVFGFPHRAVYAARLSWGSVCTVGERFLRAFTPGTPSSAPTPPASSTIARTATQSSSPQSRCRRSSKPRSPPCWSGLGKGHLQGQVTCSTCRVKSW